MNFSLLTYHARLGLFSDKRVPKNLSQFGRPEGKMSAFAA